MKERIEKIFSDEEEFYATTYEDVIELMGEDKSLDYLRPIKDARPFKGLNLALTVWDKDNIEHVVKLTVSGFVSWKSEGQELFVNNHKVK